jgi:hypothetical protein
MSLARFASSGAADNREEDCMSLKVLVAVRKQVRGVFIDDQNIDDPAS